jgi:hypothetical protein
MLERGRVTRHAGEAGATGGNGSAGVLVEGKSHAEQLQQRDTDAGKYHAVKLRSFAQ